MLRDKEQLILEPVEQEKEITKVIEGYWPYVEEVSDGKEDLEQKIYSEGGGGRIKYNKNNWEINRMTFGCRRWENFLQIVHLKVDLLETPAKIFDLEDLSELLIVERDNNF